MCEQDPPKILCFAKMSLDFLKGLGLELHFQDNLCQIFRLVSDGQKLTKKLPTKSLTNFF